MIDTFQRSFGIIIAYVLPGLVGLWGLSAHSPIVNSWLSAKQDLSPSVGGFLYVVLGSLALGLTASAVRWAIIDAAHHATAVRRVELDFSRLQQNIEAFNLAVEHYYRYYQHYANMFVAIPFAVASQVLAGLHLTLAQIIGLGILEAVLFVASRDSLRRYYDRTSRLLGTTSSPGE